MSKIAKETKYLQNKIGLIQAGVSGHAIGICMVANENHKKGLDYYYNYDAGKMIRQMIERDVTEVFNHAYRLGRKSINDKTSTR